MVGLIIAYPLIRKSNFLSMRNLLRHVLPFLFLSITLLGCKKEDDRPMETYHITITSSKEDLKFLYFGTERQQGYSKKILETVIQVPKGDEIKVWTGFEQNNPQPDHSITVVVKKGTDVIETETQKEHVHIVVEAP